MKGGVMWRKRWGVGDLKCVHGRLDMSERDMYCVDGFLHE